MNVEMEKEDIIKKIKEIRVKNSNNTMEILKLAFENFPGESKRLVEVIRINDSKIIDLLKELSLGERDYNMVLDDIGRCREENNHPWMELYVLAYLGSREECELFTINEKKYYKEIAELRKKI